MTTEIFSWHSSFRHVSAQRKRIVPCTGDCAVCRGRTCGGRRFNFPSFHHRVVHKVELIIVVFPRLTIRCHWSWGFVQTVHQQAQQPLFGKCQRAFVCGKCHDVSGVDVNLYALYQKCGQYHYGVVSGTISTAYRNVVKATSVNVLERFAVIKTNYDGICDDGLSDGYPDYGLTGCDADTTIHIVGGVLGDFHFGKKRLKDIAAARMSYIPEASFHVPHGSLETITKCSDVRHDYINNVAFLPFILYQVLSNPCN